MSTVSNVGAFGLTYHRAFQELEAGKTQSTGFRYYKKSECTGFSGFILKLIGKQVKINGEECIVGRRSFKEFANRLSTSNPGLLPTPTKSTKALDIAFCVSLIQKFLSEKAQPTVVPTPEIVVPPKADTEDKQTQVVSHASMELEDEVVTTSPPAAPTPAPSTSASSVDDIFVLEDFNPDELPPLEELDMPEEFAGPSPVDAARQRLTALRGNDKQGKAIGFDWNHKGNLVRGLNEVRKIAVAKNKLNEFLADIDQVGYKCNAKGVVTKK